VRAPQTTRADRVDVGPGGSGHRDRCRTPPRVHLGCISLRTRVHEWQLVSTSNCVSCRDIRGHSCPRVPTCDHEKLDRTQEVAGSIPATPLPRSPCKHASSCETHPHQWSVPKLAGGYISSRLPALKGRMSLRSPSKGRLDKDRPRRGPLLCSETRRRGLAIARLGLAAIGKH
jgi:hypothetical protein